LILLIEQPFWEKLYADTSASAFSKRPSSDVKEFYSMFPENARILDVGCGEGRNAIFLARTGTMVDAFDISENGIQKAKSIYRRNIF
jgi:tellurite methyltransferase